jgi:hypothetical protein
LKSPLRGQVPAATGPPRTPAPRRTRGTTLARYNPKSQPKKVIAVEVGTFSLLVLAGDGGLALAGLAGSAGGLSREDARSREGGPDADASPAGGAGPGGGGTEGSGNNGGSGTGGGGGSSGSNLNIDYEGVEIVALAAATGVAVGDRSRTWQWPGTSKVDAAAATLPARLIRRSPLLARVFADGAYLRSMLGSASLVGVGLGLALGVIAVEQTAGRALPPSTPLTIAIAALGVIDATAGLAAVLAFTIGVIGAGGLDTDDAVRTMLALAALWFVIPLVAGAARPLRREPPKTTKQRFDRGADFVIASLIGAYAVQELVIALPGLSGYKLPIGSHSDEVAVWILIALVVRMLGEQLAAHLYPERLGTVQPRDLREPSELQRLGAAALRTGIFLFIAVVVVGATWQLWVAGGLFLVPQAMEVYEERFPKSDKLGKVLPEGLLEVVFMLFLGTWLGALVVSTHSNSLIADSFVLLSIPAALLAILHRFGAEEEEEEEEEGEEGEEAEKAEQEAKPDKRRELGWAPRFAGTAILAAGVLEVLGVLS